MERLRLIMSDIVVGEPLQWDVYGDNGDLILRKGHSIDDFHLLETLFQRSLFIDAQYAPTIARNKNEERAKKPEVVAEAPSALRLINLANRRLEKILYSITAEPDVPARIADIAGFILQAIVLDSTVALACIPLNQKIANYAVHHCVDTAVLTAIVATAMQKPPAELHALLAAALTMNLGMLRQQDLLQSKTDAIGEKEKDLIRRHPQESVAILKQVGVTDQLWLDYVLMHHENEQGTGYPGGKSVTSLPQNVKILALADHYCAAVAEHKYRKVLTPSNALRDLFSGSEKNSDPMLAAYFIKLLGVYPAGSLVRLQNNEIGLVTGKGESHTTPIVHTVVAASGTPVSVPLKRDTSKPNHGIREVLPNSEISLRFSMQQLWGSLAAL